MSTISRQFGLANPTPVSVTLVPLATAANTPLPRAPVQAAGYARPFADTGFTSRCPQTLPQGDWQQAWIAPADANFPPSFVIANHDRIALQGGGGWRLLDSSGKHIADGRNGPGPVYFDTAHDRLFYLDINDQLIALNQRDGRFDYLVALQFGDLFSKSLLATVGNDFIIVAVEQEGMPHRPAPPDRSAIQVIATGTPLARNSDGSLSSLVRDENLQIGSVGLLAALQNGRLTATWPNRLMQLGLDLQVHNVIEGNFHPGLLTTDEAGRAYIVLADEHHERALWVISEAGARILSVGLPTQLGTLFFPPIIGFDHRIFILTRSRLLALAPTGERLWQATAQSEFVGACVTADGTVLAADGSEVAAFAPSGARQVLARLPGKVLTPPILTADETLLAADAAHLYAFRHH